jgi:hypothetical protein
MKRGMAVKRMQDMMIKSSSRYHLYIYFIFHQKLTGIESRSAFELRP